MRDYHTFVGCEEEGKAFLAGRLFAQAGPIFLPWIAVEQIEKDSASLRDYPPIACLIHFDPE